MRSLEELRRKGLLATDAAVSTVVERFGVPGSGDNARVLEANVGHGFRFEVLADRGFDIGLAEYRGTPISWRSPVSDARPLSSPAGNDWLGRFTGGLLVTCGLRVAGAAAGSPLHGDISHRPASHVRSAPPRGRALVELGADIDDESIFGAGLRVERSISSGLTPSGQAWIGVDDGVVNTSSLSAEIHILYHLNFGAPVILPGTEVTIDARRTLPRDADSTRFSASILPATVDEVVEAVYLHEQASHVHLRTPGGHSVAIEWSADTLPYLHQWIFPTRGRWALGIEPATSPLFKKDDTSETERSTLEPGHSRTHRLRVTVGEAS
ncbi:DUF4432 family protein [Microbacterium sp. ABRD28]|uniref:DUF4432 family protein n=1 Tax=Microbacterium sp. ABRD28 TaxID=2268461 RepID=UPI000F54F6C0|nr:DUF4432 family protein [Microbacterium sp. ABRD28]AZC12998.1 DUF4432 family protein [Microbacterium sp. ABRD28]